MQKIEDISKVTEVPVMETSQGVRYIQVGNVKYYRKFDIMQGPGRAYRSAAGGSPAVVKVIPYNKRSCRYITENPMLVQRWHKGVYISAKWLYNYIYWRQLKLGGRGAWDPASAQFIAEELGLMVISRDKTAQREANANFMASYCASQKGIKERLDKLNSRHARLVKELAALEEKINKLKH